MRYAASRSSSMASMLRTQWSSPLLCVAHPSRARSGYPRQPVARRQQRHRRPFRQWPARRPLHLRRFHPRQSSERQCFLDDYRTATHTTIFFEAPHRISDTLATMAETFDGVRPLAIARELSKQFEQIAHLSVATAPAWLAEDNNRQRGEFVLLLGGAIAQTTADWQPLADDLRDAGLSAKTTAALVAKHTGANKKAVYQYLLDHADD